MLSGAELPGAVLGCASAHGHGAGGHLTADRTNRLLSAAPITCPQVPQVRPRQGCSSASSHTLLQLMQPEFAGTSSVKAAALITDWCSAGHCVCPDRQLRTQEKLCSVEHACKLQPHVDSRLSFRGCVPCRAGQASH